MSCVLFDGDCYADDELVTRGVALEPCLARQTTARSEPLKGLLQPPLSSLGRFPSADSWFASLDAPAFRAPISSPTVLRGPRDQEPRQLLQSVVDGLSDAYPVAVLKPIRPKHLAWACKLELLCGFEPLVVKLRAEGRDLELRRSRGDGFQFASVLRACRHLVQGSTAAACRLPPPPEPDVQALVAFAQAWPDEGVAALGRQALALNDASLAKELAPHSALLASWLASPEERVALAACALCARLEAPELADKAAKRAAAAGLVGLAKAH